MLCHRGDRSRRFRPHLQRTRRLHAGQPPRCGRLLRGPAHADTQCRAVVPQRCPRLSDIRRKPLLGCVLVPHPARRQASRRGEKSRVWLSRPPYMFFPFSSPIDLEELMCRRSQDLRTSGRLKIRRCSRSWLNYASPIVLEVSILVLIENAVVWRFCWALVGGKRVRRPLLLFRRGEVERLRHRCVCSSPPSWRSSNNRTEASIESRLVSESDSNATVSKESSECNKRDFAASTRLLSR